MSGGRRPGIRAGSSGKRRSAVHTTYGALQAAFDFFNAELFADRLTPVVFVFFRKKNMCGCFRPAAWRKRSRGGAVEQSERRADEIALNPDYLLERGELDVLSTLVHEQVHQLQLLVGSPSRKNYHNAEWAGMAEAVGLTPTTTGQPGGARVGQKMDHLIVPGGPFEAAALRLLDGGWDFEWEARSPQSILMGADDGASGGAVGEGENPDPPAPSKLTYRCPQCGLRAWAKPATNLMCGDCLAHLIPDAA